MLTTDWALRCIGHDGAEKGEVEEQFGQKLIYFGVSGGWMSAPPSRPLHLKSMRAFYVPLTFAVVAEPARTFVFGVDGNAEQMAGSTNYATASPNFRFNTDVEKQQTMSPALRADA